MADNATLPTGTGGQAAPAGNSKQQSGAAAPAGNGAPAGSNPSTPSIEDAIVAEKKKAEHWQKKYERDVSAIKAENDARFAKLEGLTQGLAANQSNGTKRPPAKTFADLDETELDGVIKRGIDESNPGFVSAAARELADRIVASKVKDAEVRAEQAIERRFARERVNQKIVNEFGAAVLKEDSEIRTLADQFIADKRAEDPQHFEKFPRALYDCFALADRELRQGERGELERLRKAESDRQARDQIERSNQVTAKVIRDDVAEKLKNKDMKGAIRARLGHITERLR